MSGTLAGGTNTELGTATGIALSRNDAGHELRRPELPSLVYLSCGLGKQPNWGEEAWFGVCKIRGRVGTRLVFSNVLQLWQSAKRAQFMLSWSSQLRWGAHTGRNWHKAGGRMICQVLYTCNTHNNPARKVGSFTRQRLIEQLIEFFVLMKLAF